MIDKKPMESHDVQYMYLIIIVLAQTLFSVAKYGTLHVWHIHVLFVVSFVHFIIRVFANFFI